MRFSVIIEVSESRTSGQSNLTKGRIAPRTKPPRGLTTSIGYRGLVGLSTTKNYIQNYTVNRTSCPSTCESA